MKHLGKSVAGQAAEAALVHYLSAWSAPLPPPAGEPLPPHGGCGPAGRKGSAPQARMGKGMMSYLLNLFAENGCDILFL